MNWADPIINALSNPSLSGPLVMGLELAMRMWPTAKPWSLLIPIRYACNSASSILKALSDNFLTPLIQAGNNVPPAPPALK